MNLKKYREFSKENINENLARSKKFIKERELMFKAAKDLHLIDKDIEWKLKEGEKKTLSLSDFDADAQAKLKAKLRELKLSDDDVKRIERDEDFTKLRDLLSSNIGYLYNFVYMYYVDMVPFEELETIYADILDLKPILDRLKTFPDIGKNFDANFIDPTLPNARESRNNAELLVDGLELLKDYRIVKKILDTLPRELKRSYDNASVMLREEMVDVAKAFENISDDMTKEGITKKDRIWKNFFGEMKLDNDETRQDGTINKNYGKMVFKSRLRRFVSEENPIRSFIKAAKAHIEASLSDGYSERIEKIEKCNDKLGIMGCEVKFNGSGIMVIQVNSYQANVMLNSHSNHCIVNYQSQWTSYLGDFNKQYYIYNFNISSLDDLSTIGITIEPGKTWPSGGCQSMRNTSIGYSIKSTFKKWEEEYALDIKIFDILEPMSDEEIEIRKKAKVAERKIVEKGISIEDIKEYVTVGGADINKDNAAALINSVEEDDYEKAKLCLSLGANPNLAKKSQSAIAKAKDIKMIKLLVSYGSDLTGEVFNNIMHDTEALEYCLKAGLDPNFSNSLPFRRTLKGEYVSIDDMGTSNFEEFKILLKYGAKIHDTHGRNTVLKWAADYGRLEVLKYLDDKELSKGFTEKEWREAVRYLNHNRKLSDERKAEVLEYLESKF